MNCSIYCEDVSLFNIELMEAEMLYNSRQNILNIKLMEESISDEYYTEGVVENIRSFFKSLIEKIVELAKKIKEKIVDKIESARFQAAFKNVKKAYAANRAAFSNKKIKYFDYKRFYKMISDDVEVMRKAYKDVASKEWDSFDELNRYLEKVLDTTKVLSDKNEVINFMGFELEIGVGSFVTELDYVKQYKELYVKLLNDKIKKEMGNIEDAAVNDASKDGRKGVTRQSAFKKIGSKLSKLASILSSGFLKYGDKILNGLAALSAAKGVYNIGVGIGIERSGGYGFGKITDGAINVSNAVALHNLSKKVASAREDKE